MNIFHRLGLLVEGSKRNTYEFKIQISTISTRHTLASKMNRIQFLFFFILMSYHRVVSSGTFALLFYTDTSISFLHVQNSVVLLM